VRLAIYVKGLVRAIHSFSWRDCIAFSRLAAYVANKVNVLNKVR